MSLSRLEMEYNILKQDIQERCFVWENLDDNDDGIQISL